ncbi:hypothetical protein HYV64_00885 [Candidatus Shapirobacteria bacterium]|nr:hypothetical protein [Candidatus Shapirobacteria bacterium]
MTRIDDLVSERINKSGLYKDLDEDGRHLFEQTVRDLVEKTVSGGELRIVRTDGHKQAMGLTGTEEILGEQKKVLAEAFNTTAAAVAPALRNSVRDVLLALADPVPSTTIADIVKRRQGQR